MEHHATGVLVAPTHLGNPGAAKTSVCRPRSGYCAQLRPVVSYSRTYAGSLWRIGMNFIIEPGAKKRRSLDSGSPRTS
jgi:hypothetical protein